MRKIFFLSVCGLFISFFARSQQLSPTVIPSDGGTSKAAGISLEWTLGEISIESLSTPKQFYTQGFHQPILISKTFLQAEEITLAGYEITVAPNPVLSVLTVNINSIANKKVYISLLDIAGRRFPAQVLNGISGTARIDMSAMISGIYLLEIRNATNELIKSFKIIKGQ